MPPAADPPCDKRHAGERQNQHCGRSSSHGQTPAVPQEQRAVQVCQPTLNLVRIGRGHVLTCGRVNHSGAGRTLVEPIGGDPARGRTPDLLDARMDRLYPLREDGNRQAGLRLRRGETLGRRKDRQCGPAQSEDGEKGEGQKSRPAMKCSDHDPRSLHVVGEISDVASALNGRAGTPGRERHRNFVRAVAHVLDRSVDVQGIACIEKGIRKVERNLE